MLLSASLSHQLQVMLELLSTNANLTLKVMLRRSKSANRLSAKLSQLLQSAKNNHLLLVEEELSEP